MFLLYLRDSQLKTAIALPLKYLGTPTRHLNFGLNISLIFHILYQFNGGRHFRKKSNI